MKHHVKFLSRYLASPSVVGAVAPSSPALARALCDPYRRSTSPVQVLEVGAGTGAVTRHLGSILRPEDRLDICEVESEFVNLLERDLLSDLRFAAPLREGRVRLLHGPVQSVADLQNYDFIISGLPLTSFSLKDVQDIMEVLKSRLNPGGVFSYFEYVGLRKLTRTLALGAGRRRIRQVSQFLTQHIRDYQFERRTILNNLPPAHVRHWTFTPRPVIQSS